MGHKVHTILESAMTNSNPRTVLQTVLESSEIVFPHYHTHFSETFELLEGSISVYQVFSVPPEEAEAILEVHETEIQVGKGSTTIPPGVLHKYQVGKEGAVVCLTFKPGSVSFEKAMCVLRGVQKDNEGYK